MSTFSNVSEFSQIPATVDPAIGKHVPRAEGWCENRLHSRAHSWRLRSSWGHGNTGAAEDASFPLSRQDRAYCSTPLIVPSVVVLGTDPRVSHLPGKCSTTELYHQSIGYNQKWEGVCVHASAHACVCTLVCALRLQGKCSNFILCI